MSIQNLHNLFRAGATLLTCFLAFWAGSSEAVSQGVNCHIKTIGANQTGPNVEVTVTTPTDGVVRSGESFEVAWKVRSPLDLSCRTPLYLVFSMPEHVRFEGEGFFTLPPKVDGPFGLPLERERMRVFVPLHVGDAVANGTFKIRPYVVGDFDLRWAAVEVPKIVPQPKTKQEYAWGKWVEYQAAVGQKSIAIQQGRPTIVLQDRFTNEKPKRLVISSDNRHELHDFGKFFRIWDRTTNSIVLEGSGAHARFSPTGRFVYAMGVPLASVQTVGLEGNTTELEVTDLYAGAVVLRHDGLGIGGETAYYGVAINSVRWGVRDSFLVLGYVRGQKLTIHHALIKRVEAFHEDQDCYNCPTIGSAKARVDIENAVSLYGAHSTRSSRPHEWEIESLLFSPSTANDIWAPLETDQIRRIEAQAKILEKLVSQKGPDLKTEDAQSEQAKERAEKQLSELQDAVNEKQTARDEKVMQATIATHVVAGMGALPVTKLDPASKLDEGGQLVAKLAYHTKADGARLHALQFRAAFTQLPSAPAEQADRLARRLTEWGLHPQRSNKDEILREPTAKVGTGAWFKQRVINDVPAAQVLFDGADYTWAGCALLDDTTWYDGSKVVDDLLPKSIDPTNVVFAKVWKVGQAHFWLLGTVCSIGTGDQALFGQLALIDSAIASLPRLRWLSLRRFEGKEVGKLLGIFDGRNVLAELFDGRYLAIAAEGKPSAALFDLAEDKAHVFTGPGEGSVTKRLMLTEDRRHLIQLTEDGQLSVYAIDEKRRIASGRFIDDEIVFSDHRGYYGGTPEGAHYIYLKFPGVPGYHTFHQFRATLDRPDIIRSLLADRKVVGPEPRLSAPPTVQLSLEPGGRTSQLDIAASSEVGLSGIRIFVDGRLEREEKASGRQVARKVTMDLPPNARWVTVQAVDVRGHESVPMAVSLGGAGSARQPSGNLLALAVGTDRYSDRGLRRLHYAEADAATFAKAVKTAQGRYYKSVKVEALAGQKDLKAVLLDKVQALAAGTRAEDTIMLFVAGHGVRDKSGRFYLATPETKLDDLQRTAIASDVVAGALKAAKGRVIVFLDTCHSGAADGLATNDDAAAAFLDRTSAITVIAASKGRQYSQERAALAGGVFTKALEHVLTRDRTKTDANKNGAIELSELYGAVKRRVVELTKGEQTPWIARNQMVGEIPLF